MSTRMEWQMIAVMTGSARLSKRRLLPIHHTRKVKGVCKDRKFTPWQAHGSIFTAEAAAEEKDRLLKQGWEVHLYYV